MDYNLKTGDILLCGSGPRESWPLSWFSYLIKLYTHSPYSHVAMVLVDPSFIHPALKGSFVWESSNGATPDPQDDKKKLGVRITPLADFLHDYQVQGGRVVVRPIKCPLDTFNSQQLELIHDTVYGKPYDLYLKDWLEALLPMGDHSERTINRFWCSALVGYIYTQCGIVDSFTNWSFLRPSDFSMDSENLNFLDKMSLGPERQIL